MSEVPLPEPESFEALCAKLEAQAEAQPAAAPEALAAAEPPPSDFPLPLPIPDSAAVVLTADVALGESCREAPAAPLPEAATTPVAEPAPQPAPQSVATPPPASVEQPYLPPIVRPVTARIPVVVQPLQLSILVSALTDMGCVRTNNEDFFGYHEGHGIFVVCDGMGGMASGEVASSRAVTALVTNYMETARSGSSVGSRLLAALQEANRDVWIYGQSPQHKGMGTTAVAAALEGNRLIVGNVGDSRAYVLLRGQCTQLTVDHSYVNELIRNGTLTPETARSADLQGMESVICRAIGVSAEVEPDFYSVDLEQGMTILICTDGLTRYLSPEEIAVVLGGSTFETACFNLISVAKQRGGVDNITCLILHVLNN